MDEERMVRWIGVGVMVTMAALEAWLLAEQATGGQTREVIRRWWRAHTDRWFAERRVDETVAREAGGVIWEAMETLRGDRHTERGEG